MLGGLLGVVMLVVGISISEAGRAALLRDKNTLEVLVTAMSKYTPRSWHQPIAD